MCTAIVYKGKDLIYGFDLDIDPSVWNYDVYMTKDFFSVGITVGAFVTSLFIAKKHYDYSKM